MATRSDQDVDDDDFADIYKEYTGPPGFAGGSSGSSAMVNNSGGDSFKRKQTISVAEDEGDEGFERDPNAVPTDFTSREAKVWEAKSKATERNWKKRKEEEMICKICGESGHFTQGCPSTLGSSRRSQDFFERVAARDPNVRDLFTDKVMSRIEKDVGCKLKLEEKFLIVSGKDRLILAKGVDAVHKVIKGDSDQRVSSNSQRSRSRSSEHSPMGSHFQRFESQRSYPGHSRDGSHHQRVGRQDKSYGDRIREEPQKFPRNSLQAYEKDGSRGRTTRSRSPVRAPYTNNSYGSFDGRKHNSSAYRSGWDVERRESDIPSVHQMEYSTYPQNLEGIDQEYYRELMDLARIRDKEEDEENYKHREIVRELRENYTKRWATTRASQARQWSEFLQMDSQRPMQQPRQQMHSPGFSNFKQHQFADYNGSSANPQYANMPMDSNIRYANNSENYPSRATESYNDYRHQKRDEFGKNYNSY